MRTAVLLLAYGGPDSLDDIPAYLSDVRGGRPTPQALVDEITHRYAQIGSCSPLLIITRRTADKLNQAVSLPVYVGMRHWSPWIKDAVAQMAADGVQRIVAICLAPHYSHMSIGAYQTRLTEALTSVGADIQVDFVSQWHTEPAYLDGIVANVQETLRRWPEAQRVDVLVVFTAHSLPEAILQRGDPYDRQLRETTGLLAQRLGLTDARWSFSYQSAAQTGVPWLGPQIEALIPGLAEQGRRHLLIAPVGFIADHVEILYDIDIGLQAIAHQHGVRAERTPMLNDGPALVSALAAIVERRMAGNR